MSAPEPIVHPLLERVGVAHGFGVRGARGPDRVMRPRQIHGRAVARVEGFDAAWSEEADAIVCRVPGIAVAVVTADCVPVLACSEDGRAVAAIHAGWRGLADGVVEAGIEALRGEAVAGTRLLAVIGPCIGPCCYEVDGPVLDALAARFGEALERFGVASRPRPGHAMLDLSALVAHELEELGIPSQSRGLLERACTACDPERYDSFRRDGSAAGRLVHHIACVQAGSGA